jgi:hypothetical protein
MKLSWKLTLVLVAAVAVCAMLLLRPDNREKKAVAETRRVLRQQGFKTDLADFDFSTSPEDRARADALNRPDQTAPVTRTADYPLRLTLLQNDPDLLMSIGTNAALVVWRQAKLPFAFVTVPAPWNEPELGDSIDVDLWPTLRDMLGERRAELDAACQAALSGPIRFDLDASRGSGMLLRHVATLRKLAQTLGTRLVLDLHDQNYDAAWTNLLAVTRLVTAWDPEPSEISHSVRFSCAALAYRAAWQALRTNVWVDGRLARLQDEWQSADFFRNLPETQAFDRACNADLCQRERRRPMGFHLPVDYVIHSTRSAWSYIKDYGRRLQYHEHGSYEDEKALLLYYRDRELEFRQAVQAPTWAKMRGLPGVTNVVLFQSRFPSALQSMMNTTRLSRRVIGGVPGILAQAAEAETRRRLVVAAVAVERYRLRHGSYPETLSKLVPEFLSAPPTDFMDSQPLRSYIAGEGDFVLYSIGLDCIDDKGKMRPHTPWPATFPGFGRYGVARDADLVWPRAASPVEILAQQEEDRQARAAQQRQATLEQDERERSVEALRRETVEELLTLKPPPRTVEPTWQGRPLRKVLHNNQAKSNLTLDELLTARQIITGQEPDLATFEVPVSYDTVTHIGQLCLLVDAQPADLSTTDGEDLPACTRATNGHCLLVWNTGSDAPGSHALQVQLLYSEGKGRARRSTEVKGPVVSFLSTNLCQFIPDRCELTSRGLVLYARLSESNGNYAVELKSLGGAPLKTFTGTTSNGVIEIRWDLIDQRGHKYTNDSVDSVFHVTLPASGRSQTQRGP